MTTLHLKSSPNSSSSTDASIRCSACSDSPRSEEKLVIPQLDSLPSLTWPEKLAYLAHAFSKMEQRNCPLEHRFESGLYIRVLRMPKDTLIIGGIHKLGHRCRLLSGSLVLIGEHARVRIEAPHSICTVPGSQLACYTLTDCVAETVHPNEGECRDIEALEREIFEPAAPLIERGRDISRRLTCQQ
jgi:hypothetical protein